MKSDFQVFFKVTMAKQSFDLRIYRQNARMRSEWTVDEAPVKRMSKKIEVRSASYPENQAIHGLFFVRGAAGPFDATVIGGDVSTLEEVFTVLLFGKPYVKKLQMAEMRL